MSRSRKLTKIITGKNSSISQSEDWPGQVSTQEEGLNMGLPFGVQKDHQFAICMGKKVIQNQCVLKMPKLLTCVLHPRPLLQWDLNTIPI